MAYDPLMTPMVTHLYKNRGELPLSPARSATTYMLRAIMTTVTTHAKDVIPFLHKVTLPVSAGSLPTPCRVTPGVIPAIITSSMPMSMPRRHFRLKGRLASHKLAPRSQLWFAKAGQQWSLTAT